MSKFDDSRLVPILIFFGVLMGGPCAFPAQTPTQTPAQAPTEAPAPSTASSPAAVPQTPRSPAPAQVIVPAVEPTPEELGDSLAVHQRYQAAIAAYSKAQPITAAIWNKMGIAYQMMFDVKDAIRCYNTSLKLQPRNSQVLNNLATAYDSQKQYKTAERLYRKALKIDPHSALIHRNLGSNLLSQHKYKKGAEAYRAALAIDPQILDQHSGVSVQNPASLSERGALHYYMAKGCVSAGNSECAIQNLRLALNEGFTNAKKIASDNSFASLRDLPAFQKMIAAQSTQ
jgi:tetratricopeptide (TPR) repeat protein